MATTESHIALLGQASDAGDSDMNLLILKNNGQEFEGTGQIEIVDEKAAPVDELPEVSGDELVIDIAINNVVGSFNTRCHLNLKSIAMESCNVEFKKENGMLNMKLRHPYTTATIWSSGKVICTGATSEEECKIAGRKFARKLQKLGYNVRFSSFRVVNVLGTCFLPFGIKINGFSRAHPDVASYEPELHPGVTYRIKLPKATLKIFSTGSITVTAPCVANVQSAIEHIYPLVSEYKMDLPQQAKDRNMRAAMLRNIQGGNIQGGNNLVRPRIEDSDDDEELDTEDDESFDSEVSQD